MADPMPEPPEPAVRLERALAAFRDTAARRIAAKAGERSRSGRPEQSEAGVAPANGHHGTTWVTNSIGIVRRLLGLGGP